MELTHAIPSSNVRRLIKGEEAAAMTATCAVGAGSSRAHTEAGGSHAWAGRAPPAPSAIAAARSDHVAGLAALVGCEKETAFLLERQRLAWKGESQLVLIPGEPGIGRSRLAALPPSASPASRTCACATNASLTAPQRAASGHRPVGASSGVQGRRYLRATPRQAGAAPRHGRPADADPLAQGVNIAGRMTVRARWDIPDGYEPIRRHYERPRCVDLGSCWLRIPVDLAGMPW
jgi:hypothetical protein